MRDASMEQTALGISTTHSISGDILEVRLRDSKLHLLNFLEKNNLLALNTGGSFVGSGGFGCTSELPQLDFNPAHVRTTDIWGFGESQETVVVGPELFAEFVLIMKDNNTLGDNPQNAIDWCIQCYWLHLNFIKN